MEDKYYSANETSNETLIEETKISQEPFYLPVGNEKKIFLASFKRKLPLLLKGPTGCGKSRFIEHMAFRLKKTLTKISMDKGNGTIKGEVKDFAGNKGFLVTIPCHEDLTANDLVGRFFLTLNEGAEWIDGPLRRHLLSR